jgi:hypothetical protein
LSEETETPPVAERDSQARAPSEPPKTKLTLGRTRPSPLTVVLVCALVISTMVSIWLLQPKQMPEGRPVGEVGKVLAFALPSGQAGESYAIWRDGRKTAELISADKAGFQRIELSSNDVDVAGSADPDLVLYTWTGGAHCCFSQVLIDGRTGRRLGSFDIGNGDPTPFIPTKTKGLARAVAINVDDVTAFKFGAYADSPMARILVVFEGNRFGLDIKRMKAAMPDNPPSFFISEPELAEAATIGVQDFGEDEERPAAAVTAAMRGDRAKAYERWMAGEEDRMRQTALVADDVESYGPMAAFLNERIYKGHAAAGVATVLEAYKDQPELAQAALAYYFDVLRQSRWLNDLDRLNGGALKGLIAQHQERARTEGR